MSSADTVRFICAACGYRARIPAGFSGKVILCPGCQKMQIASPDGGAATGGTVSHARVSTAPEGAPGQVSVVDAQGKIRFTCAKCGFHAKLAANYAGKAISCPGCQAPQLIPPLDAAHSSAGGAATPAVSEEAASLANKVSTPAESADEPGITVDDPTPFGEHMPVSDAPSEATATPKKPAAAPAKPLADDAEAPAQPTPAVKPVGKPKRSVASIPAAVPGKGVVRRGGRAGAAQAAEEEATAIAEEDAAIAAEEEELAKPPKELPAFLKPIAPYLERLHEPKVLVTVGVCVVLFILQISLIWAWRSAAGSLAELRPRHEATVVSLEDTKAKLTRAEYDLGAQISKAKDATDKLLLAQSSLAESQKTADDQKAKAKQAEIDHQKEYDQRKVAEGKLDVTLDKLAKAVAARDEDYKKRVEAEKARDEEAKLRKELKDKLDELAKAPK
jgi:hypothetical protein